MGTATLFVHYVSIFCGLKRIDLSSDLEIKFWKLHWILNFIWVIDISGWLSSGQFLSAALPVI